MFSLIFAVLGSHQKAYFLSMATRQQSSIKTAIFSFIDSEINIYVSQRLKNQELKLPDRVF